MYLMLFFFLLRLSYFQFSTISVSRLDEQNFKRLSDRLGPSENHLLPVIMTIFDNARYYNILTIWNSKRIVAISNILRQTDVDAYSIN